MIDEEAREALRSAFVTARGLEAPVNERLKIYADALQQHLPTFATAVDRLIARLEAVGAGNLAPKVGDPMPAFLLPDQDGKLVSLAQSHAQQPIAIAFHRGHWCPYCQINTRALAEAHAHVRAAGADILAIAPELQKFVRRQKSDAGAPFRILSDVGNGYALSLNIAIWVGDEVRKVMGDFGRDLATSQGNDSWFLPIPATFIVNTQGVIVDRFVDPDYRRRMDTDALILALKRAT